MRFTAVILLQLLFAEALISAEITNNNFKITRSPLSGSLAQQTVRQSFQDDAGLMWFLTDEGLHRYDGYELKLYQANGQKNGGISHNNVRQILQDHSGKIWIAMDGGGLNYYDPETSSFLPVSTGDDDSELLKKKIRAMIEDDSGYIWIGYWGGEISIFDPFEGKVQQFDTLNLKEVSNGLITSFAIDDAQHMWIGTSSGGLIRYNRYTGRYTRYGDDAAKDYSFGLGNITSLLQDDKSRLWIGTESDGLILLDGTTMLTKRIVNRPGDVTSLSNNSINTVYKDNDNRIWVGTDEGLNLHVEDGRFIRFTEANSNLTNDLVANILQDDQGNFWIGTHYGLYTGFQSRFDIFDSKRGLPADSVTAFAETGSGDLWVGSYEGLFLYDEETKDFLQARDIFDNYPPSESRVMSMAGENFRLWVGTKNRGVDVIDTLTGAIESYNMERSDELRLNNNSIVDIAVDGSGSSWVATYGGGVNEISANLNQATKYHTSRSGKPSINSNYVMKVVQTSQNELYIGTTVGLNRYDQTRSSITPLKDRLEKKLPFGESLIMDIHEDLNGNIWLGTKYSGLKIWNINQIREGAVEYEKVDTIPALPSSTINSIEEDSDGFLWLATNNGLVKLDPTTRQIITFDFSDGLQDNEFNFGASFKDSQGRLYFGGNRGYNRFQPQGIVQESEPPPMVMTSVIIAGEPVEYDAAYKKPSTLHLKQEDYFINFEFSALDYTDPAKNRYQYQLENYDPKWINLGPRHNVSFTSLPSGIYHLRIKGANSDGVWNHEGLSLTMKVHPPPWLSWWAFSCYGALLVWLLWFFRRYYDNYLLRESAVEDAASMQITAERAMDDLQDQLETEQALVRNAHAHAQNTLGVIAGLLSRQAEAIGDQSILELFTDNQVRFNSLQLVENNLYYMIDRLEVNFRNFVEDLINARFDGQPHVNVDIAVVNETNDIGIPATVAVAAAMIVNELFCNSIKHAFDTVTGVHYIRIAMEENTQLSDWTLEVSDSGAGLPESIDPLRPTTLGMEIVLHFVRLLNAELKVIRGPGTHFIINIPKPPPQG